MKKICFLLVLLFGTANNIMAQAFDWYKRYPTKTFSHEAETTVNIDANSSSIIHAGFFNDSIRFGNQLFLHNSGSAPNIKYGAYLAKYDQAGSLNWVKSINSSSILQLSANFDQAQNIFVSGIFKDSLRYNSTTFTNPGYAIFIMKVDPNGNVLWAKKSSAPASIPTAMILQARYLKSGVDLAGNFYLTGTYNTALQFENTIINTTNTSGGSLSSFILKYNGSGNLQWLKNSPSPYGIFTSFAVTNQDGFYYISPNISVNSILYKFDSNGDLQWTKNLPEHTQGLESIPIGVDETGNAYLAGYYRAPFNSGGLQFPINNSGPFKSGYYMLKINKHGVWKWKDEIVLDFPQNMAGTIKIPGKVYKDFTIAGGAPYSLQLGDSLYSGGEVFAAKYDTLGTLLQSRKFYTANFGFFGVETITNDPLGNTYFMGNFNLGFWLDNVLVNPVNSTPFTRYLTKLQNYSNSITGTLFQDLNGNGIKDTGELPVPDRIIAIEPGPILTNSLANGNYGALLPAGSFNIKLSNSVRNYTANPGSYNFSFTGQNQTLPGKDFALTPIPNSPDAKITLTPLTPARPGFGLVYNLTFANVGTTILSDSLTLNFDSNLLTFAWASAAPVVHQAAKLTWTYQNLQPTEKRSINISFRVDSTVVIGTPLQATAIIKPLATDLNQQDNYDTLNQVITGSFDPNDKQVNFERLTPAEVSSGKYLDYTIRFQNTGTDTAFTVIVRDVFTKNQDLTHFEILAASHPYTFKLLNNSNAEWRFNNILLPDSHRNEAASHGFIRYRVKAKSNLVLGDAISSRASIFFDYNAPILTNYATTIVANQLGITGNKEDLTSIKLYPNPADNFVIIESALKKKMAATVSLVNMLGQTLSKVALPANDQIHYQMPLKDLPKGVYIIQLKTETGIQAKRLVIQ